MAVKLDLAAGAYLALYEELGSVDNFEVVADRADMLSTSIEDLAALYRGYWDAHVHSDQLPPEGAANPLGEHHGALASWIMAPLRGYQPSAIFSAQTRSAALTRAEGAGFRDNLQPFRIAIHGWVVGRVVGKVDNDGPVLPAPLPEDPHLRSAYEGLLEHVEQEWMIGRLYEVAGSSVVWRFGGLTEAISPQPDNAKDNIGASLSRLMRAHGDDLPIRVRTRLAPEHQEALVQCRNALTHVAERGGVGFAHAADQSTDEEFVGPLIQAASYFVCAAIGGELQADEGSQQWSNHLDRVENDLRWAHEFL